MSTGHLLSNRFKRFIGPLRSQTGRVGGKFNENFHHYLSNLPTLNVGQKHNAQFECELNDQNKDIKVSGA